MAHVNEEKRGFLLKLLASVANGTTDEEMAHSEAEDLLLELLQDAEIEAAWSEASGHWWYA